MAPNVNITRNSTENTQYYYYNCPYGTQGTDERFVFAIAAPIMFTGRNYFHSLGGDSASDTIGRGENFNLFSLFYYRGDENCSQLSLSSKRICSSIRILRRRASKLNALMMIIAWMWIWNSYFFYSLRCMGDTRFSAASRMVETPDASFSWAYPCLSLN